MKETYSKCEIEIIKFEVEDVIITSDEVETIDPGNDPQ